MVVDTAALGLACGLRARDLERWGDAVAAGTGFLRFSIRQKNRRPRFVLQPRVELDRVLKQLRGGLTRATTYHPPPEVHGFVRGRGIVTNAARHLNQDVVLRVDIRDFFGSIDQLRVSSTLAVVGLDPPCAAVVSKLCVVDDALAQGFSTSPLLSNIAFLESDRVISQLADQAGVRYTRYVDDLIFSGSRDAVNDDLLELVENTLGQIGWKPNPGKTRFMRRGKPQYVTGLYVGDPDGPHIPRTMKRLLRREVYFALKYGVSGARFRSPTPMSIERLSGWIHYAAHVDPSFGIPLRDKWRLAAPSNGEYGQMAWDEMLEDLDLPSHW